ncbi:hypothetical protein [Halodesulfovibrio sp. MK-HDV]|uniref:hypothetical protein n=1 Tax=Halodesulfovibrio sp. MK-HDV TaxID=2599925 RepID=UPI00136FD943|nr:hypothetical protein [Halodesulfovibrio sp. MK-HDV]KAF1075196.1 hypothetical protein MKHDV_02239 [Halodesulfovibrio sp. MK-HDV]
MRLSTIFFAFIITCILTTSAFAHRVNIFAWAEGTTIHTESFFSSGSKAQNSAVTATDKKTGKVIAKGITNSNGEWSFPLSADAIKTKDPIVVTLDAGQGHASSWTLQAEDFADAAVSVATEQLASTKTTAPTTDTNAQASSQTSPRTAEQESEQKTATPAATVTLTKTELDTLIRTAVRQELVPIKAQVAKLNAQILQPTTNMKDIFGGIGYILGLLGLAAFMQYRKKS